MTDNAFTFHLIIHGPNDFSAEYDIPIGITTIGRDADNHIVLDDRTVTRHHARLECVGSECDITDLGSSNGTSINSVMIPVNTPVPLKHQDRIGLGPNFEMVFLQTGAVEEALPSAEAVSMAEIEAGQIPPAEPPSPPPQPPPEEPAELIPPGLSIHSQYLLKYLPGIYHTEFMSRFLGIFEAILLPIEWTIDNFDHYLSPRTAPAAFLPWLANWYDAEFDSTWSEDQRRLFLEEACLLYARRGTKWALSRVLEIYTGQPPEVDDLAEDLRPQLFRVALPMSEESVNRVTIEALINYYKPVHTDYELYFRG